MFTLLLSLIIILWDLRETRAWRDSWWQPWLSTSTQMNVSVFVFQLGGVKLPRQCFMIMQMMWTPCSLWLKLLWQFDYFLQSADNKDFTTFKGIRFEPFLQIFFFQFNKDFLVISEYHEDKTKSETSEHLFHQRLLSVI